MQGTITGSRILLLVAYPLSGNFSLLPSPQMPRANRCNSRKNLARRLRLIAAACFFLLAQGASAAQQPGAQVPTLQRLQNLAAAQQWPEIAQLIESVHPRNAEMDYYFGLALAHTGHAAEAARALEAGSRLAPHDSRFPEELAGLAFEKKDYPRAARLLRRAVKLAPHDEYAENFLATIYFLEDNLPAALQSWNRIGKPYVDQVSDQPEPGISPALLDHAFAFSPAATLQLKQFYATDARLRGLGIFPQFHFDLDALSNGHFNVAFRSRELDGLGGGGKLGVALIVLRGLPFLQIDPDYYDFCREGVNFNSIFRWDAQKRRIFAEASGPFQNGAKYRWNFHTDLRNENWALRKSFAGPAPLLASFNMRRELGGFNLASFLSGRHDWSLGAEMSHRDFRNVAAGAVLTPQMLAPGLELKQTAQATAALLRAPGHRFTLSGQAQSQAARQWSNPRQSFEKLTGALAWQWFPQAQGDNYEMTQMVRAGHTFGQPPLDELFILGLDQDNNLPLRAHIATRDGRKGSAPMGRDYFLENWDVDKDIYSNGLVRVQLGPFLDVGHISDPGTSLGSHQWLFDTGIQANLRVLGVGVAFTYGKDLRTGNNAFYALPLSWTRSTIPNP